ncbi:adenosine deaminase [Acanthamoeba castellanii str. Neff]|uniref:adenosine deaminase n=1 Tax=Acanthamoeba castellanii (strain ATCC 30010 / Neff) TaxID=1257118 RepID=L8GNW9_ACACF|nr:adenosine deaminase [Acanthamoeba castellanii str. Neff]ELR14824.1 adenosine deaminase [Acanthamoeba castellanii str. Neff]
MRFQCCITSNIQTRAIKTLEDHPIRQYFDAGAIVVPCTDNKTMSNCTLTGEYALFQKTHKFNVEEMLRLIDYGFSAAFMQATHKRRLRGEVLHSCLQILHDEGYDLDDIIGTSHYWHSIGVDLSHFAKSPAVRKQHGYWSGRVNPPITLDIVRALPKADLNCRIDGSVSIPLLWQELQAAKIDMKQRFGLPCSSLEADLIAENNSLDLRRIVLSPTHDEASWTRVKRIFNSVLQHPDQIKRATDDILRAAADENVRYIELVVRPRAHTHAEMTIAQVIDHMKEAADATVASLAAEGKPLQYGLVVYSSLAKDDPIDFLQAAQLTVQSQSKGVCGFGVLGTRDLQASEYEFFRGTFDYLKRNNANVNISAGRTDPSNVVKAIHEGGACRVSGAYQVHRSPDLMNYCANHSIPIELGLADRFSIYVSDVRTFAEVNVNDMVSTYNSDVRTFAGNPIRLFLDNLLPVAICSFKSSVSSKNRSEVLFDLVNECNLSIAELMKLLSCSFENNFQPYDVRQKMVAKAWEEASTYLSAHGYSSLYRQHYFPSLGKGMDSFSDA